MWKVNSISDSWIKAEDILIPKVDGATAVDQFRIISLQNVEGKFYFANNYKKTESDHGEPQAAKGNWKKDHEP